MSFLLLAAYGATSTLLPPTNPTILRALTTNRYDYVDPMWMFVTMAPFPMLPALWLLLVSPGLETAACAGVFHRAPRRSWPCSACGLPPMASAF